MGDVVYLHPISKWRMERKIANEFEMIVYNKELAPESKAFMIRHMYPWDKGSGAFPVVSFARELGLEVYRDDLSELKDFDIKGYLALKPIDEQSVIVVSEDESYGHQRWTIAHEIWHYILNKDKRSKSRKGKTLYYTEHGYDYEDETSSDEEVNANAFATALLMPENEFIQIYEEYKDEGFSVQKEKLEEYFQISPTQVKKRIKTLNL